ncbi:MAG: YihY/virulence factor BrkB family protein [Nitrospiraceae bacterium]|nr:MAG: YihY/virulence factor BrkB family protein [Nitrospiraceae bacterium]
MMNRQQNAYWRLGRLFSFLLRVLRGFRRNQGLLLSGAVAYHTLLSIVPMSILALIGLSHFIGEKQLFQTLTTYLEMVMPGYAATLIEQVRVFLEHRRVIGIIGFLVMLFFSSIAFTVLESAMSVIFFHRVRTKRRHALVSAIIPYVYIFLLGLGILLVSFIAEALDTLEARQVIMFGWSLHLQGSAGAALYILGVVGEVLMLTSIYLVMPVVHVTFRHAVLGGITATVLWEITRRVLVWYYSVLSLVNLIYGSIATIVVALLSVEAVALILLLGAQVIAELERKTDELTDEQLSGFET